jgi:peptidyl-prolyl cis-trans isomerase A (cyclophilin A)
MKSIFISILVVLLFSCNQNRTDNPYILIDTSFGNIELELFPKQAPKTVAAFLSYVDSGFYTNTSFYRVLKNEDLLPSENYGIIQGGVHPTIKTDKFIEHEPTSLTGLSHTDGVLSLASQGAGTASTEFFICIGSQSSFDAGNGGTKDNLGFPAFGTVVKGMKVVRKIQAANSNGELFIKKIVINKIERL